MNRMFDRLISAVQFITVIPVGVPGRFDPHGMIRYFPMVGIILGTLLSAVDLMGLALWSRPVAAMVDVLFLAVITGAFHLDGLGDTADGLFSHRGRQQALHIMKDSRVGVMGLVAIVAGLAVKWGGISGLEENRQLLLILVPAYARCGILFGMRMLPYGRPEGGTGHAFFSEPLPLGAFWGVAMPVLLTVFLGWTALVLNGAFFLIVGGMILFYRQRMGCVTGDMLGAMSETIEALLFLIMSIGFIR